MYKEKERIIYLPVGCSPLFYLCKYRAYVSVGQTYPTHSCATMGQNHTVTNSLNTYKNAYEYEDSYTLFVDTKL